MTYHKLHSCSTKEQLEEIVSRMYPELSSGKSIEGLLQKYFSNLTFIEITSLAFKVKDIIYSEMLTQHKIKKIVLEIEYINMKNNKCGKMSLGNYHCGKSMSLENYDVPYNQKCFSTDGSGQMCLSEMNGISPTNPNCVKKCQQKFTDCGGTDDDECDSYCSGFNTAFSNCSGDGSDIMHGGNRQGGNNYGHMSNVPDNRRKISDNLLGSHQKISENLLGSRQKISENLLGSRHHPDTATLLSNVPSNIPNNVPSNRQSNVPNNVPSNRLINVQKISQSILVPLVKNMLSELKSKKISIEDLLNTYLPSSLSGEFGALSNKIKSILNSSNSVEKTVKDIVSEIEKVMMVNGSSSGNVPASGGVGSVEEMVMKMLRELQAGESTVEDLLMKYLPPSLTQYVGMLSHRIKTLLKYGDSMENKVNSIVLEIKNVMRMGGNVPSSGGGVGSVEEMVMKMLRELQAGESTVEDLLMKYLPHSLTQYVGMLSHRIKTILKSGDYMENKVNSIVSEIKNIMRMGGNVPSSKMYVNHNNQPNVYVQEESNECYDCNEYLALGNAYKKKYLYSS